LQAARLLPTRLLNNGYFSAPPAKRLVASIDNEYPNTGVRTGFFAVSLTGFQIQGAATPQEEIGKSPAATAGLLI